MAWYTKISRTTPAYLLLLLSLKQRKSQTIVQITVHTATTTSPESVTKSPAVMALMTSRTEINVYCFDLCIQEWRQQLVFDTDVSSFVRVSVWESVHYAFACTLLKIKWNGITSISWKNSECTMPRLQISWQCCSAQELRCPRVNTITKAVITRRNEGNSTEERSTKGLFSIRVVCSELFKTVVFRVARSLGAEMPEEERTAVLLLQKSKHSSVDEYMSGRDFIAISY